jgi:ABC-2 type transport system ATP-binding protein
MSQAIVQARGLSRTFGKLKAVDNIDLDIPAGAVVGLIGPNGAGKTSLLRALLGLSAYRGELEVLGANPRQQRAELMKLVSFIADTAVLPGWMKVNQLLDYVAGVHLNFNRDAAEQFLNTTDVGLNRKIRELSKGMTVQLHLAMVMAIDARLLVLDEPTLGLDILFRKRFFDQLLNDYFFGERTIIISTHQVEEVENILTHVVFMNHGKVVLNKALSEIEEDYLELHAVGEAAAKARAIPHIGTRNILGGQAIIYEHTDRTLLSPLGELRTPSVSNLFVAKVAGGTHHE